MTFLSNLPKFTPQDLQTVSSDKSGSSVYTINQKVVKLEDYLATLESHNILVKAKNFLVFQGDVEAIASQNPKSLSKFIDQISGSVTACLFLTTLSRPLSIHDLYFVFFSFSKALWSSHQSMKERKRRI